MNKKVKKLLSSVLAVSTLVVSVFATSVSAETVTVKYGDYDGDGVITSAEASKTLGYARNANGLDQITAIAASLGFGAINASSASFLQKKVLDPTFELPNGDEVVTEIVTTTETTTETTTQTTTETTTQTTTDASTETTTTDTSDLPAAKVFVLGDSTGASFGDPTYYYKRVGFGVPLGEYFNDKITVVNLALSGRSSKSYVADKEYTQYLNELSEGDYVLIAFGHNDQKAEADRYTNPTGDKSTAGSFQNSLYTNYIKPALDKGATPILCTPIVRRSETTEWSPSKLHVTSDAVGSDGNNYPGGDYAQAIRDLAADSELNLTLIDNTVLTKNLYDELTPSKSVELHAWTSYKETSVDNTHINNYGAHYVDYLMANALKESSSPLGKYVKADIAVPDKATYLVVNPDYVMPKEGDPDESELSKSMWDTIEKPFYGTVFGNIGGSVAKTNYDVSQNSDGSIHLRMGVGSNGNVTGAKGKIAGTSDGISFYYLPLNSNEDIEMSGEITVNSLVAADGGQGSFGLMIADTIQVDTNDAAAAIPYVSAGVLGISSGTNKYVTFQRKDGTLSSASTQKLASDFAAGDKINVRILKNDNKVTATFGDVTAEYEVDMSDMMYVGFYVSRCVDITVSNINYTTEVPK